MQSGLHARLAGFYFFYYAAVGAFLPYFALWLEHRGYGPAQIGVVFALLGATRIALPLVWGWLADRMGARMPLVRVTSVAVCVLFAAVPFAPGYAWLLVLMFAYNVFWNATLPQYEVVTLNHLEQTGHDYSLIRLWGSVGFVIAVMTIGPVLDHASIEILPWTILALMVGMVASSFLVNDPVRKPRDASGEDQGSLLQTLRRPAVVALLMACFLSQLSFAPYYGFFSLYLQEHGYTRGMIGLLWALGVAAEIGVFLYMGRLLSRWGPRRLMLFALGTTALRWMMLVLFVDSLPMLVLGQFLHLSSFGIYHAIAIHYVHRLFPERQQGRGQALYNSISFGLGGALGSIAAGYLWEIGSADAVYWATAVAAALGFWVAWRWLEHDPRPGTA
jgi:MFS transporter, PPP family, 3-phenylpropionic acid transporter